MKIAAQWLLIAYQAAELLAMIHIDINGRESKEPKGFSGVVFSIILTSIMLVILAVAGVTPWND